MNSSSYFDFASLSTLKHADSVKQPGTSKEVLQKFEALFIDQMLQAMRKATVRSELFDTQGMKMYESMFDKEVSEELAKSGGLGLTKVFERQLGLESRSQIEKNFTLERSNRSLSFNKSKAVSLYNSQLASD